MDYEDILRRLAAMEDPDGAAGMARFGLRAERVFGVRAPVLRRLAKGIGTDHDLAQRLWSSAIYECRILAALVDDPDQVTQKQMEDWAAGFDSWGVCDGCCMNLFDRTEFAYAKAVEWSHRPEEFQRRAAFALMASLAVHDKTMDEKPFLDFLPIIAREATDPRNFVKKAVNWALRQIGKRNAVLNLAAVRMAEKIKQAGSSSGRWIASDALRELTSDKVRARLGMDGERP